MPTSGKQRIEVSILAASEGFASDGSSPSHQPIRSWLRKVASRALERALPEGNCQIALVIADDDTLQRLNRDYRGLDEVTDVLSFSPVHQGHWEGEGEPPTQPDGGVPFPQPMLAAKDLGEIIISYPQAVRQAGPGPLGLEKELALLVVHGVLHLLGFDHIQSPEEAAMQAKEREILSDIFP